MGGVSPRELNDDIAMNDMKIWCVPKPKRDREKIRTKTSFYAPIHKITWSNQYSFRLGFKYKLTTDSKWRRSHKKVVRLPRPAVAGSATAFGMAKAPNGKDLKIPLGYQVTMRATTTLPGNSRFTWFMKNEKGKFVKVGQGVSAKLTMGAHNMGKKNIKVTADNGMEKAKSLLGMRVPRLRMSAGSRGLGKPEIATLGTAFGRASSASHCLAGKQVKFWKTIRLKPHFKQDVGAFGTPPITDPKYTWGPVTQIGSGATKPTAYPKKLVKRVGDELEISIPKPKVTDWAKLSYFTVPLSAIDAYGRHLGIQVHFTNFDDGGAIDEASICASSLSLGRLPTWKAGSEARARLANPNLNSRLKLFQIKGKKAGQFRTPRWLSGAKGGQLAVRSAARSAKVRKKIVASKKKGARGRAMKIRLPFFNGKKIKLPKRLSAAAKRFLPPSAKKPVKIFTLDPKKPMNTKALNAALKTHNVKFKMAPRAKLRGKQKRVGGRVGFPGYRRYQALQELLPILKK